MQSLLMALFLPVFEADLHFDLSYSPVKVCDCALHCCVNITKDIKTKLLTSPLWSFKLQFCFPRWCFSWWHANTGSEGINDTTHAVETVNEMLLLILCVTYAICWYFIWGIIEVHLQPASGNSLREYHCSFAPRITISSCELHIDPSGESFILELVLKAPTHRCSCQAAR